MFPPEYSVSGWFKWVGDYKAEWHLVFRFTLNDKPDNQDLSRMGDRTLTIFAHKTLFYHATTYGYTNMNGAGNANVLQNYQHQNQITGWHFIYFGYSKAERRAFAYFQFKGGAATLNFPDLSHYWAEKFFFVLKDSRYQNYNGQLSLV
jgi:hypothetical protein